MNATYFLGEPIQKAELDPRAIQLHRAQPVRDVPYVPSDPRIVEAMLDLANLHDGDIVYDLGCGDGRIVIEAARRGARAVGVDIDLQRIHEATENAKRRGVFSRVQFIRDSFFNVPLHDASVVTLYLLPGVNVRLRPKLLWELRPGSRIISNNFDMKGWNADATEIIAYRTLHKWIIPAWVAGEWNGIVYRGGDGRRRLRFAMHLERNFQRLTGRARVNGCDAVAIYDGRIDGKAVQFTLWHPEHFHPAVTFRGKVQANQIRGTCRAHVEGATAHAWCAVRQTN